MCSVDEKLFSLLVASVKDYAIFMTDPQGLILSWNQGAEQIKGYTEEEIIGRPISTFYTDADVIAGEPQHNLEEAVLRGRFESEGWRVRKDGSTFWADVVFTPLFDENHEHIGFAKVTRDVTERKQLADKQQLLHNELEKRVKAQTEKIIANEVRFRKLIDNSYDGISLLDGAFNVFYRSKSAERISGWNDEERMEARIDYLVHPDDRDLLTALVPKILATPGKPWLITFRSKHRQGHYIWLECLFTNMLNDEFIQAVVCNFRDITELKQQHFRLTEAAEVQTAILNALPPHIALLDESGRIRTVNESWKKFAADNSLNLPDYGIGHDYLAVCQRASGTDRENALAMSRGIKSVMTGRKPVFIREYPCHSPRKKRWFQLVAAPLNTNRLNGVVVLHIDITDRKLAERSLIRSKEKVSKQNTTLKDIAWIGSHEIRRPVASILGLVYLMEQASSTEEKEELIKMVGLCAEELDQLVHHIHNRINEL